MASTNRNILITILTILLLLVTAYVFYSTLEYKKVTDSIREEKELVEESLDSMLVKYENAISQSTPMSNELSLERDKLTMLRDSIKRISVSDYSTIRKFRKRIADLERSNKQLFHQNDSLTEINKWLTIGLDSANVHILRQEATLDILMKKNLQLMEKVEKGSALIVNSVNVDAMQKRRNKLSKTTRSKRTDAFRIDFKIARNEITEAGTKIVYIQIVNSKGHSIVDKGAIKLADDRMISYGESVEMAYENEEIGGAAIINVERKKIKKDTYTINIYIDDHFSGTTKLKLR